VLGEAALAARQKQQHRREQDLWRNQQPRDDARPVRADQRGAARGADDERQRAPEPEPPIVAAELVEVVDDDRVDHRDERAVTGVDRDEHDEQRGKVGHEEQRHEAEGAQRRREQQHAVADSPAVGEPAEPERAQPPQPGREGAQDPDARAVEPERREVERHVGQPHTCRQERGEVCEADGGGGRCPAHRQAAIGRRSMRWAPALQYRRVPRHPGGLFLNLSS
jgi:hypothetical protein